MRITPPSSTPKASRSSDISTTKDTNGFKMITVDKSYYIETIGDVDIEPERLRSAEDLLRRDVEACRTALGALQWVTIQSQPSICARCNLLLPELVTQGTMATAREIQAVVGEVRKEPTKLVFKKFLQVHHWTDLVVISMGDQAQSNRAKGHSTGGLVTLVAGPESLSGQVCEMNLLAWRTWKLRRKAIGSNDAEIRQSWRPRTKTSGPD